jgi:hypothetical protein
VTSSQTNWDRLSIGGHQDSLLVWGGLSAIPSLWYQFGTFLSLPLTWFLVQPLADSRKYSKGVVSNILESHGGRIEVFKSQSSSHTCFIAWCNVMYVLHCSSVWLELTSVDYLGALVC